MVVKVDRCSDCPLIFCTEISEYCSHPINWNRDTLDYDLYVGTLNNISIMPENCPLKDDSITIRIK